MRCVLLITIRGGVSPVREAAPTMSIQPVREKYVVLSLVRAVERSAEEHPIREAAPTMSIVCEQDML